MIEGSSPTYSLSSGSPASTISNIEFGITPRSVELINLLAKNYRNLEATRSTIFNISEEKNALGVNLYELSLEVKTDAKLLWKLCETTFPQFDRLDRSDKKTLFYNFYSKWSILEVAIFSTKYNDPHNFYSPSGSVAKSINDFYVNTVREEAILTEEEVIRIFEPYWTYHFQNVIGPLVKLQFGETENMALFGIMLWDAGYVNVSEELADVCHSMRKIICRELSSYLAENDVSPSRFFETLDTINIIEKAEHKCQEEIELCGVYNFEVDEDMRKMMLCQVCGAPESEPHFGGYSCRACAAFFRRCVHSRKSEVNCTCKQRLASSHPCRHCRMLKCLATGMIKCKVQASRERNKTKALCIPAVSNISLLSCNIIPRECSNMSHTAANWGEVDIKRKILYGNDVFQMNFTQFSNVARDDTLLLWDLASKIFPDVKLLSGTDKHSILCNFFPRWMMLDSALGICSNYEESSKYILSKDYTDMLLHFYGTSMPMEKRLKDEEILRIWKPYWDFHYYETAVPIHFKKMDKVEYMAIFLLLLFDDGYSNISEEGGELCRALRKVIKKELKGYQTDHHCYEKRFIDVMDVLLILEKAEEKIQEEVLIAGFNNIILNEDFKSIFHVRKL